jgi:3-methyladenine DNA glycosylase AlkD
MTKLDNLRKDLHKFERPEKAKFLKRFFKTGKGEYAEGDFFLGLMTDETRSVAKKYLNLSFPNLAKLLSSEIHEERVVALMILSKRFDKVDVLGKKEIYDFYLKNLDGVNNWDLVDGSASNIIGKYLFESKASREFLFDFARSGNLWKRRIAMMSTFFYIKQNDFKDALKIAEILLNDKHDLIHKAVGWMLREVGNRDMVAEEKFLKIHYKNMPRTMLRYAIEKFPEEKRLKYLNSEI